MDALIKVRTLISDSSGGEEVLSDADIQALLEIEGHNIYYTAAAAARSIAAKYASKTDVSAGDTAVKASQKYTQYSALASQLMRRAEGLLGVSPIVTGFTQTVAGVDD